VGGTLLGLFLLSSSPRSMRSLLQSVPLLYLDRSGRAFFHRRIYLFPCVTRAFSLPRPFGQSRAALSGRGFFLHVRPSHPTPCFFFFLDHSPPTRRGLPFMGVVFLSLWARRTGESSSFSPPRRAFPETPLGPRAAPLICPLLSSWEISVGVPLGRLLFCSVDSRIFFPFFLCL